MERSLIVRFSEITLKGKNRRRFEDQAGRNVLSHLAQTGSYHVSRQGARMVLEGPDTFEEAGAILKGLPGVANYSIAHSAPRELDGLTEAAVTHLAHSLAQRPGGGAGPAGTLPFKVEVIRKDKRYPHTSMEVARHLGQALLEQHPVLRVDLHHPALVLNVEIWQDRAVLYDEKVPAAGGLPVGTSGKAVCLLSGGIDSPLAAYLMMTRGVRVIYLHFHSYPFIGEQSKEKVLDLVRFLARFQPRSELYIAPFANTQAAIRDHCPEELRTVLYRRMMNRVANRLVARKRASALVTGESVGQVASQTLQNIQVINETAAYPVLQPLIGLSKQEIIARAQALGTYEISQQPFPDCCTLFQPRHPRTRASLEAARKAEEALPVDALADECAASLESVSHGPEYYPAGWHN